MPDFYAQWSAAKSNFAKTRALFPSEILTKLDKDSIGPALKTFDKAKNYEDRAKALMTVRSAKENYDSVLRNATSKIEKAGKKGSPAHRSLEGFQDKLQSIWLEADKSAQPPRPGGSTAKHEVLRNFNLGGSYKPKNIELKAPKIDVVIEIDKTLQDLIDDGEESLKVDHLGSVAEKIVSDASSAFIDTIKKIDAGLGDDPTESAKKIKEANEVLAYYGKIVQDRANKAVEDEWNAYLSRKKYLSNFRFKCVVKITLGSVAVGVSLASAVMSFGTLWMNVVAAAKALTDIAQTIKTWSQDLEKVYELLISDVAHVSTLNVEREQAKKKGQGQKASKAAEAAKEAATGILPITKNMLKSASDIENRCKQLLGLVSKLEGDANTMVGRLNKLTSMMSGLPDKFMSDALKAEAKKMEDSFKTLFDEITQVHAKAQRCAKFGERALKATQKLRAEDSWAAGTETSLGLGSKGVAVYALANFVLECAKHGTTLLSVI